MIKKKNVMLINPLTNKPAIQTNARLDKKIARMERIIDALNQKPIPEATAEFLNAEIEALNAFKGSEKAWVALLLQKQTRMLNRVNKELKYVPRHYYRTLWMSLGMAAFGLPIGVAFGMSLGNIGLLGSGLPIGLAIGVALGSGLDKKAFKEGKQLDLDIM